MKFIWLLAFVICANTNAALKIENGEVLPFAHDRYPLKELIKDYAEMMNLNATYPSSLINEKNTVHFQLNSKTSKDEFRVIFNELLDSLGFTTVIDDEVLWIRSSRESRYFPSPVYADNNFPKDASYSLVVHRLKYPLSSEVSRNLRPLMSRYGRVIDFSDARTIVIHEKGDNVERLVKSIEVMDTEAAYKKVLAFIPKKDEFEGNPLQEKVLDLELQNKLLEKKYLELKEEKK
jgi:type II secretory pathway component GspD/PulD (secretin)